MLLKNVELNVFKLDNNTFDAIGEIEEFTSLIWPDKFNGFTSFELNAPITPRNKELIKEDHVLWCGGDNATIIESIQTDTNENGQRAYKVKGRTLEMILTSRIILGTYTCSNKTSSTAMYEIIDKHLINPSDANRKVPYLECAEDIGIGKKISFQKTGGEVYDAISGICSDSELGFAILFKPKERRLIFKVLESIDRTKGLEVPYGEKLVVFSTDLEDILKSSYYSNSENVKTTAYVAGAGEGADRKRVTAGDDTLSGFLRKEMYVDARDLQDEVQEGTGQTTKIEESEYIAMLLNRGDEKLSECIKTETFEATMRVVGNVQYVYGRDYFKGDKVVVQDDELGIQVVATVTEVTENFGEEYELDITYGYSYPSLIQKIKRQIL